MSAIYCFKDVNDEIIYIVSTNNIKRRLSEHKGNCYNQHKKTYTCPLYQYMRDNSGFENFKHKIICVVDKEFKRITEQFYIDIFKPKCNSVNAVFSKKQMQERKKIYEKTEAVKNRRKLYREKNKDKKKLYDKLRYINNISNNK